MLSNIHLVGEQLAQMSYLEIVHLVLLFLQSTCLLWHLIFKRIPFVFNLITTYAQSFYCLHPFTVFAFVYFCTRDQWFCWLASIPVVILMFDFGKPIGKGLWTLFFVALHHLGPFIAQYYQEPKDAFMNACFFGWVWVPHVWHQIDKYLCGSNSKMEPVVRFGTTLFTPVIFWFYIQQFPAGLNYQTAAWVSQIAGRNLVNNNFLFHTWLQVETTGIIFCFAYHSTESWLSFFAIFAAYFMLWGISKFMKKKSPVPEKWIMTPKIKAFLEGYPKEDESGFEPDAQVLSFWEGKKWKEEFHILDAAIRNDFDRVQKLIEEGNEPIDNQLTGWFNTTAFQWVSSLDQVNMSVLLILAGADPYYPSKVGNARDFCESKSAVKMIEFFKKLDVLALEASPPAKPLSTKEWILSFCKSKKA